MLATRRLVAPIKLELDDVRKVLLALDSEGWKPAILQSEREFLALAGMADDYPIRSFSRSVRYTYRERAGAGDLFFHGDDIYYCLSIPGERVAIDPGGRRTLVHTDGPDNASVEIGLIGVDSPDIVEKLETFSRAFHTAVIYSVDGRKTRHMTFTWRLQGPPLYRLNRVLSGEELQRPQQRGDDEEREVRFEIANLDEAAIAGANVLSSQLARTILQEISAAGFAREGDVLARRSRNQEDVRRAVDDLKRASLVRTEQLLECKKTGTPLTRLTDREGLQTPEVASLRCPSCGSAFGQEALSEGYALSELGHGLCQRSHWMTIWITNKLSELGVPIESILWSLSESGEEVDMVVGFMGQLWIFELKDREFGAGDAHPLNYRSVRYGAQKTIIITTDKISRDAKRVFEELSRETQRRHEAMPISIEGLEAVDGVLRQEISTAAVGFACRRLRVLEELTGYDLSGIVAHRFGETAAEEALAVEL